jgi:hypothetical protein
MIKKILKLCAWAIAILIGIFIILPEIRELPYIKEAMDESARYGIKNESLYYSSTPECGEAGTYFRNSKK